MITQIEQALIERLRLGLGKMVYSVGSYAGEIDDAELDVRRLPACLVSYAGSDFESKAMGMRGHQHISTDTFVVLVLARSMRSAHAGRVGGVTEREIGVNQLAFAVKYLLVNQTLEGLVSPIQPKRIRTIFNNAEIKRERLSALALEFEMRYADNTMLDDGRYPDGYGDVEQVFKQYSGKLDPPTGDYHGVNGQIFAPESGAKTGIKVIAQEQK